MNDLPFPFESPNSVTVCITSISFTCLSLLISVPLLYSILREPSARRFKPDQANCVLVIGTLIWAAGGLINNTRAYLYGGFDAIGCNAYGVTTAIGSAWEIAGQALMAFDRYSTIVRQKDMTNKQFFAIFGGVASITSITAVIQLFPGFQYVPLDGNTWCFFPMYSQDPKQICINALVLIYGYVCVSTMLTGYLLIYFKVQADVNAISALELVDSSETPKTAPSNAQTWTREKAIYMRCLIIISVFVTSFGPQLMLFVYQAIAQRPSPVLLGQASMLLCGCDTFLTPMLSIYFNKEFRSAISKHVFGIQSKDSTSTPVRQVLKFQA